MTKLNQNLPQIPIKPMQRSERAPAYLFRFKRFYVEPIYFAWSVFTLNGLVAENASFFLHANSGLWFFFWLLSPFRHHEKKNQIFYLKRKLTFLEKIILVLYLASYFCKHNTKRFSPITNSVFACKYMHM